MDSTKSKKLSDLMTELDDNLKEKARKYEEAKPYLDKALRVVESIDRKISHQERIISNLEEQKKTAIKDVETYLDLAMVSTHALRNGYTIMPDNRYKIFVDDTVAFMKWLKENKEPHEVLEFFKDALKVTALKAFANKEYNAQRLKGVMEPEIDGIDFGEEEYNRYTTKYKKPKKEKK